MSVLLTKHLLESMIKASVCIYKLSKSIVAMIKFIKEGAKNSDSRLQREREKHKELNYLAENLQYIILKRLNPLQWRE